MPGGLADSPSEDDIIAALHIMSADTCLYQSFVQGLVLFELAAVETGGQLQAEEIAALLERDVTERWSQVGSLCVKLACMVIWSSQPSSA